MALVLSWISAALANSWGPVDEGFLVQTRTDAPLDGQLIYVSNFVPVVTVIEGPGAPFELTAELVTGVGAHARTSLRLATGTWEPDSDYVIAVDAENYDYNNGGPTELSFRTGDTMAPAADLLEVAGVTVSEWSEDAEYAWGCCYPTRRVEVEVSAPDADPWAYVEVVGDFQLGRPSQITTEPIHTHLALEMGPGPHTLVFQQWLEDGVPQPPCFEVVAVSSAGVAGASQAFCEEDVDESAAQQEAQCGCSESAPGGLGAMWMTLALLVGLRRRRQS